MTAASTATPAASRALLGVAAGAVAFAAADTYVVVLALPDMMSAAGLSLDQLQRAAPIVSGFLLGYVGMLPLIGRIADLRGRTPVLIGSLVVFAIGSLVTASSYDLAAMVVGRFIQGVGGGGLVPATLALVADLWPAERRGLPLGVVGAVQELGAVIGPLYGAVILALGSWRDIFWLNLAVGLVLAAALMKLRTDRPASRRFPDPVGVVLLTLTLLALAVLMLEPVRLVTGVSTGLAFVPVTGGSRWLSPLAFVFAVLLVVFCLRQMLARRPLVGWRTWHTTLKETDLPGASLLGIALGGIIIAFASADPEVQVFSPAGPYLLAMSAVATVLFAWRQRTAAHPLVPRGTLARRPAWGSLVVSLFVGAALIAALVDIPFFARITIYPDSQLDAALVLVRFLVAIPVGALLGGWLTRHVPAALLVAIGMAGAGVGFALMTTWDVDSLRSPWTTVPLVVAGLGFGLAIAPINAALLATSPPDSHGVASALVVVARMVGMLVGISALTTIGLRRFYAAAADIPGVEVLCPTDPVHCDAYTQALTDAGIVQLHTIFIGAALCAVMAGMMALATFPGAATRGVSTAEAMGARR